MTRPIGRREFLRVAGTGAAALSLLPGVARARSQGGLVLKGEPQHVIVIGGGLAGLSAAHELRKAGHSVTILEGRKQPGGRVRTLRSFDDGLYAELGPMSFPLEHEFTTGYVTELGLSVRPVFRFGLESVGHVRGSLFRIAVDGSANIPFSLKSGERQAGVYKLPSMYFGDQMKEVGNPRQSNWPSESLLELDQISARQFLTEAGASDGAIDLIEASRLGLVGYGLESLSALDAVVIEALATGAGFFEIIGGNDQLPKALRKKVKKFFTNLAVVERIEQDETGVTVTYNRKGITFAVRGDRAICTLPFSVLKDIEVFPEFSPQKRHVVDELKMTPVTRTIQQFSSRTWEAAGLDGNGISDTSIQTTYSPTLTQFARRGLLASYTAGDRALHLSELTEKERQKIVTGRMGNLFGNLRGVYEKGKSQIWHRDEFAKGAYAYFGPGEMTTLLPAAQKPEGRIHFAGEHTSAWHGWMNGALESGNRVAKEINDSAEQESILVGSEW